jgi:peptidoglycan hydrolase CwlO-like protein
VRRAASTAARRVIVPGSLARSRRVGVAVEHQPEKPAVGTTLVVGDLAVPPEPAVLPGVARPEPLPGVADALSGFEQRLAALRATACGVFAAVLQREPWMALEQFLEENGTGDEIIEEFENRLGSFESDLNSLESELNTFQEELDGTQSTVESVSGTVDELDGDVGSLENSIEDVEGTVETMEGELSNLEGEIESVREEIGEGELDERLSEVEDEIVELKEWREQLSSVIG